METAIELQRACDDAYPRLSCLSVKARVFRLTMITARTPIGETPNARLKTFHLERFNIQKPLQLLLEMHDIMTTGVCVQRRIIQQSLYPTQARPVPSSSFSCHGFRSSAPLFRIQVFSYETY